MKQRINGWLDSDLVGIPATLYTFLVLVVSLAVFRFGGPVAGIIVAVALWVPMVVFAIRGAGQAPAAFDIPVAGDKGRHRVLVVANRGLEDEALCAEICRRADHAETEAMILVPVSTGKGFVTRGEDVSESDLQPAAARLATAIETLQGRGVTASGHISVTEPLQAAIDGLREFPANELVILPGHEDGWEGADALAARIRAEVGLPVTVVDAESRDSAVRS